MKEQLEKVLAFLRDLRVESLYQGHEQRREAIQIITDVIKNDRKIKESIADISYMAGVDRYASGDSRRDIADFIHLAERFEEEVNYRDENTEDDDFDTPEYMDAIEEWYKDNIKVTEKIAFDYPNGTRYEWDNTEIAPCKDDGDGTYRLDGDEDQEPDFWTVYLHMTEGGAMAVADLPTEKLANDFAEMLNNAVISFKDNGYMPLQRHAELHRKFNLFIDERIHSAHSLQTKAAYEIVKDNFNNMIKP